MDDKYGGQLIWDIITIIITKLLLSLLLLLLVIVVVVAFWNQGSHSSESTILLISLLIGCLLSFSFVSTNVIMALPGDVFYSGTISFYMFLTIPFLTLMASTVYLPVFRRLKITSVFEVSNTVISTAYLLIVAFLSYRPASLSVWRV